MKYKVTIHKFGEDHAADRVVRVVCREEHEARTLAAKKLYGARAYFRGDLPGVPACGQFWWNNGLTSSGATSSALTGRCHVRVEEDTA